MYFDYGCLRQTGWRRTFTDVIIFANGVSEQFVCYLFREGGIEVAFDYENPCRLNFQDAVNSEFFNIA
jgi:hypothetical protein